MGGGHDKSREKSLAAGGSPLEKCYLAWSTPGLRYPLCQEASFTLWVRLCIIGAGSHHRSITPNITSFPRRIGHGGEEVAQG